MYRLSPALRENSTMSYVILDICVRTLVKTRKIPETFLWKYRVIKKKLMIVIQ